MVRAKMVCNSSEGESEASGGRWPRVFKFSAMYDPNVADDQRYALATPFATLEMHVDNPAVSFEPGRAYYLDFTPAE